MAASENLGELINADVDPDRKAFIDLGNPGSPQTWTYKGLEDAANGIADELVRRGMVRGSRVGLLMANGADFLQSYLGILRAGMVAVPINYKLPADTVDYIFEDAGISLAFVDAERAHLCPTYCDAIPCEEIGQYSVTDDNREANTFSSAGPEKGEIAEILYTSGSTGMPKGVLLDHAGQLWAMRVLMDLLRQNAGTHTLIVAPCYHMNGLFLTLLQLNLHGTVVSMPVFDAKAYIEAVAEYRCTTLSGVPTMFELIARSSEDIARHDFSFVTSVSMGSAPAAPELLTRMNEIFPNAVIRNVYGTTEAGPAIFGPHPDGVPTPISSLGFPLPGVDLKLVGGETNRDGVLNVRSPAAMIGYRNLEDKTAEKLRDGWYDTGDEMRKDGDGFYYFVGRSDDMFVCGGENIHPGSVESMLTEHEQIAQAAVVPVHDDIKGQIPVAFIVRRDGSKLSEDDVKQFALEHGPAYSHPRHVHFRDALRWVVLRK